MFRLVTARLDGASTGEAISEPPLPTICLNEFISATTVSTFNSPTPPCIGIPADLNQQLDRIRERNRSRTNWTWWRFAGRSTTKFLRRARHGASTTSRRRVRHRQVPEVDRRAVLSARQIERARQRGPAGLIDANTGTAGREL